MDFNKPTSKGTTARLGFSFVFLLILIYYINGDYMQRTWEQNSTINTDDPYEVNDFKDSIEMVEFKKMPQPRTSELDSSEIQVINETYLLEHFSQRRKRLKDGCEEMLKNGSDKHWVWTEMKPLWNLDKHKKYFFCRNQKVGSTSWRALAKVLKKSDVYPESKYTVNILPVRHPFDRLKSAYTDKFLNGRPISTYDEAYKNSTGSKEDWMTRWSAYWLPALISSGKVKVKDIIFKEKIFNRRFIGMKYEKENDMLTKKYLNSTFSFLDFLNHVIWSYKHGLADRHWVPQYKVCKVCSNDYKYIIKLETSGDEIPYVIKNLNFTRDHSYGHNHQSTKSTKYSYEEFFSTIPNEVLKTIYELYKYDFLLFGYSFK